MILFKNNSQKYVHYEKPYSVAFIHPRTRLQCQILSLASHSPSSSLVDTLGDEVSREGCFERTLVLERVVALSVGHAGGGGGVAHRDNQPMASRGQSWREGLTHLPLSNQQSKTSVTLRSTPLPRVEGMVMSSTLRGREERTRCGRYCCKSAVSDRCCKQSISCSASLCLPCFSLVPRRSNVWSGNKASLA